MNQMQQALDVEVFSATLSVIVEKVDSVFVACVYNASEHDCVGVGRTQNESEIDLLGKLKVT